MVARRRIGTHLGLNVGHQPGLVVAQLDARLVHVGIDLGPVDVVGSRQDDFAAADARLARVLEVGGRARALDVEGADGRETGANQADADLGVALRMSVCLTRPWEKVTHPDKMTLIKTIVRLGESRWSTIMASR